MKTLLGKYLLKTTHIYENYRAKEIEAAELRREVESIKAAKNNQLDNKHNLEGELDTLRREIEAVTNQNTDVNQSFSVS